ncbi:hypothetical protein GO986_00120 [Deinococcus sp. HMF7620]|uniref:Uncharacterized protein n=1 Tax=Deinococcus arboris TaxID=2682977 RepID=A0A7C9LJN7_9DEIO|nr:hypothetical protein [Deinococcus arboris]MVN85177.1 hypothetical protein [Deinococcus arboris]
MSGIAHARQSSELVFIWSVYTVKRLSIGRSPFRYASGFLLTGIHSRTYAGPQRRTERDTYPDIAECRPDRHAQGHADAKTQRELRFWCHITRYDSS